MLVLSRKKDEAILIGDDIMIVVNRCGVDRINLAIDAPKHIRIVRAELTGKDSDHDNTASN